MSKFDKSLQDSFFRANNGPVNNSTSKQLYSFSKASRFRNKDYSYCRKTYYDHQSTLAKRSAAIGYGDKTDFTKLFTRTPPPGQYQIRKSITNQSFSKTQNSFGPGRVHGKFQQQPGPEKYNIGSTLSNIKYSIRHKNDPKVTTISPGPGAYEHSDTMSPSKSFIGKYQNAQVALIDTKSVRKICSKDQIPGPQRYNLDQSFSPNGKYTLSQFPSQSSTTFGKQIKLPHPKSVSPGPGKYQIPGEFGYY